MGEFQKAGTMAATASTAPTAPTTPTRPAWDACGVSSDQIRHYAHVSVTNRATVVVAWFSPDGKPRPPTEKPTFRAMVFQPAETTMRDVLMMLRKKLFKKPHMQASKVFNSPSVAMFIYVNHKTLVPAHTTISDIVEKHGIDVSTMPTHLRISPFVKKGETPPASFALHDATHTSFALSDVKGIVHLTFAAENTFGCGAHVRMCASWNMNAFIRRTTS